METESQNSVVSVTTTKITENASSSTKWRNTFYVTEQYEVDFKIVKPEPASDADGTQEPEKNEVKIKRMTFSTGILSKASRCHLSVTYFRDVNRIRLSFRLPNKIGDKSIVMKPFRVNSFNKQGTKVSFPNRKPLFDVSKRPNPAALNYKRYIKNIALGRRWGYWKTRVDGFRFTFVVDIEQAKHPAQYEHPLANMKSVLGSFCNSNELSDMIICCDGKEFPVHRLVLSMSSPVFRAMFDSGLTEAREGRVDIPDLDYFGMEQLLKWMYSGEVELTVDGGFESHKKIYKAAAKYCVDPLKNWIVDEIESHFMKAENALQIFELGNSYDDKKMLSIAIPFIEKQKKLILGNKEVFQDYVKRYPEFMQELLLQ